MNKTLAAVCLLSLGWTSLAIGQELPDESPSDVPVVQEPVVQEPVAPQPIIVPPLPQPNRASDAPGIIPGISPSQMTPEMYLYLYELKRLDDPKQAVRRKAELKTAQRNQRLAAQKWFGVSNARPMASAQPFMDLYSPRWIGNGYNAFDWVGAQGAGVNVLVIEPSTVRR